jgi:branched-chain amino acid transport system ATP-binding protein
MNATPSPVLDMCEVRAGYGPADVLKGLSLAVRSGEIVALLGANGAGKTTTLRVLTGLLPVRHGTVRWQQQSLEGVPTETRVRHGICLCPEGRRIFPRLTVFENLRMGGFVLSDGREPERLERVFHFFPRLAERRNQLGGTLSGGEQQMLALGRALMGNPRVLLLDEPSLGLAPLIVERIFEIILEIHHAGTPILLVEQNAHQALRIAHRAYVLVAGTVVLSGTGQELLASDEVRQAYLGEDGAA